MNRIRRLNEALNPDAINEESTLDRIERVTGGNTDHITSLDLSGVKESPLSRIGDEIVKKIKSKFKLKNISYDHKHPIHIWITLPDGTTHADNKKIKEKLVSYVRKTMKYYVS